jgi:hypothetical protein
MQYQNGREAVYVLSSFNLRIMASVLLIPDTCARETWSPVSRIIPEETLAQYKKNFQPWELFINRMFTDVKQLCHKCKPCNSLSEGLKVGWDKADDGEVGWTVKLIKLCPCLNVGNPWCHFIWDITQMLPRQCYLIFRWYQVKDLLTKSILEY